MDENLRVLVLVYLLEQNGLQVFLVDFVLPLFDQVLLHILRNLLCLQLRDLQQATPQPKQSDVWLEKGVESALNEKPSAAAPPRPSRFPAS